MEPTVRALGIADWPDLRRIRLEALLSDPGAFHSNHTAELGRTDEEWQRLIAEPGQRVFGLFAAGALAGLGAVFSHRDDPSGCTALFGMSYIRREYRGRGFARLLHEARLGWVRSQQQFRVVQVSHRASNLASGRAIVRSGFALLGRVQRLWPDGVAEDELLYEMRL
jgi:RimJ/RimL family protein N-acetyltransferase